MKKETRVLVTGANGFVGRNLSKFLAFRGLTVFAASRSGSVPVTSPHDAIIAVRMPDLFDQNADYGPLVSGIDVIVHTAALAHADLDDVRHDQINRHAVASLVKAARRAGVKHFIFISSAAAQSGPAGEHVLTESDKPKPDRSYGRAKLAAEHIVQDCGIDFSILRPVAIYGSGARGSLALLEKAARLPFPLPFASLHSRRSILSMANMNEAVLTVLNNPKALGATILVADPEPSSIADIVTRIRLRAGRKPNLVPFPPALLRMMLRLLGKARMAQTFDRPLSVSTARLQSLGWKPVQNDTI